MKRLSDVGLVLLTSPLTIILALGIASLVWVIDGWPVFYSQRRTGQDGQIFWMYKFRSMINDAEPNGPVLASREDERITAIGRVLRRYALDELPQLWNVLRGDMALVGPRPERPEFVVQCVNGARGYRHSVRPGLTGMAQLGLSYNASLDAKLAYVAEYIKMRSWKTDATILVSTINRRR